jgi:hypothetical protein
VDRDRKVELACQGDLLGEDRALGLPRRVHVVVVETAFTKGHDAFVAQPFAQACPQDIVELRGLMGMDAGGGEDPRIALGEVQRRGVALDAIARSDGDQRVDAAHEGALDHRLAILVEAGSREMAMAVEPHC